MADQDKIPVRSVVVNGPITSEIVKGSTPETQPLPPFAQTIAEFDKETFGMSEDDRIEHAKIMMQQSGIIDNS